MHRCMILLVFFLTPGYAFTIAEKYRTTGPAIHRTYFITQNDEKVEVNASVWGGNFYGTECVANQDLDIGKQLVRTGDYIEFDANKIKSFLGASLQCMTVYYYHRAFVQETFALLSDDINYFGSFPEFSQVKLF